MSVHRRRDSLGKRSPGGLPVAPPVPRNPGTYRPASGRQQLPHLPSDAFSSPQPAPGPPAAHRPFVVEEAMHSQQNQRHHPRRAGAGTRLAPPGHTAPVRWHRDSPTPSHTPGGDTSFARKVAVLLEEHPETVIGEAVRIKGELDFDRLLRVDGSFEGELRSGGSVIVGPTGSVLGDVIGLKVVICQGRIKGQVSADKVLVSETGCIEGDVMARRVVCEEGGVLSGSWNVHRQVPAALLFDERGKIVRHEAEGEPDDGGPSGDGGGGDGGGGGGGGTGSSGYE